MKKHKKISSNHHCFAKILSTIIFGAKIQIVFDCSQTKCYLKLSDNSVCRVWIWVHHEHFSKTGYVVKETFLHQKSENHWFLFDFCLLESRSRIEKRIFLHDAFRCKSRKLDFFHPSEEKSFILKRLEIE